MNYYEVLHISQDAPEEIIKLAYKGLAQKYHPDRYKGADANQKMVQIREAYEILIDPVKRKNYDQFLVEQERRRRQQEEYMKQQQQEEFVRRQKAVFEQQNKANSNAEPNQSKAHSHHETQDNSSFKMDISINISKNFFSIFLLFKKLKEWVISIIKCLMAPSPAKNYQPNSTEQSKNEKTNSTKKFLESFKIFAITFVSVICIGTVIIATIQPKNIESPTIESNISGGYSGGIVEDSTTTTEENVAINNYDENYVSDGWTTTSATEESTQEAVVTSQKTRKAESAAQEAERAAKAAEIETQEAERIAQELIIAAREAEIEAQEFETVEGTNYLDNNIN